MCWVCGLGIVLGMRRGTAAWVQRQAAGVGRNHVPVSARCQVGSGLRVQGFRVLGSVQGDREHSVQGLELGVEP